MSARHHAHPSTLADAAFESDVFETSPASRFAVLVAARGGAALPRREEVHARSSAVRELVFVGRGLLRGPERDADEDRACAIAVVENIGGGLARVAGGVRLIFRTILDDSGTIELPLPIETEGHFGDLFDAPLPSDSVEVSRLCIVADSGALRLRMLAALVAFTAGVSTAAAGGDAYAMLGDELVRPMRRFLPLEELSPARMLEYPTPKVPVLIRRAVLADVGAASTDPVLYG
ncbi:MULTISPECIES: hypothetical protein [unclassified Rathayibacter]|uniref:hypothetical protein n=1 Tax=unclassified Rathayibacter TaxID=2609250 RepID=UPI0006FA5918|nr:MULTISPECIES: hypothetical protein [unclassified Rathayibacter]KQQ06284.1 hypothetical protein ASF42_07175 [Rathayibacter sp. Leaf294]KQS14139.1 hypothetical protein ASG06_07175 [Rathayibacter sp. Leaf185]